MTRHRPRIERGIRHDVGVSYRLRCSCGAIGEWQCTRWAAGEDLAAHLEALPPVPPEQRCEFPLGDVA